MCRLALGSCVREPAAGKKSMAARFVPVKGYDEFFKVEPCESAFKMKS